MSRIPEHFIDNLVSKIDIVDVINARVPLKQKGHEFGACCPFHDEKTPSFTVSPEKQFYHCFGCGAHGSVIGFLMHYENLSFVESIESLASSIGVAVVQEQSDKYEYIPKQSKKELDKLSDILQKSSDWFELQLLKHPNKNVAIDYLKNRGLSGKIIKDYHIGFAPKFGLLKALGNDEKSKQLLFDAGLLAKNNQNELYERFRSRIQFPIHNFKGETIGFGGRTLVDDKAKYYNSPETKLFHKGKELYGLYQARANIKKIGFSLVVEGYMDVVALAQFGVQYAVATLGTATSLEHLKILFRTSSKIVCCFDGDKAGVNAAVKAMKEVLPLMRDGRTMAFMFLPENEDPDSFIRKHGKEKFEKLIKRAKLLDEFMFAYLEKQVSLTSIDGRAKLADLAKPLLKQMTAGIYFELMLEKLAELTQINEDKLRRYINLVVPKTTVRNRRQIIKKFTGKTSYDATHKVLAILLNKPILAKDLQLAEIFSESHHPDIKLMLKIIKVITENPEIHTGLLYEKCRNIEGSTDIISKIYNFNIGLLSPLNLKKELFETLNNIQKQMGQNKRRLTAQQSRSGEDINALIKNYKDML